MVLKYDTLPLFSAYDDLQPARLNTAHPRTREGGRVWGGAHLEAGDAEQRHGVNALRVLRLACAHARVNMKKVDTKTKGNEEGGYYKGE